MKKVLSLVLFLSLTLLAKNTCIECHKGIADIRDKKSQMMKEILVVAEQAGHKGNDCIVCHGGNPSTKDQKRSHSGTVKYFLTHKGPKEYYPAPASPWINEHTCGMCHKEQVASQHNSLMQTEQGKIQGTLWGFGGKNGYKHDIGNYVTKNPEDPHSRLGSPAYKKYMQELSAMEPDVFPREMTTLPQAPTAEEVEKDPTLAVYTYLRQDCLRCHTGSKGRQKRGDFRGIGCAACHIPYSNSGLYEGSDKTISKDPGHMLVHSIQSSRKTKVKVHDIEYSGVPVETCTTCHNRGKRIGVSYQGLMETSYNATYDEQGNGQPKLHTKKYLHMKSDIHYQKGMLCQDCHTSNDLHGDGFLSGTTLAPVEIECQDCHGTTKAYPWELPLGYSDEFSKVCDDDKERGTTRTMAEYLKKGTQYEAKEGYLLSARGNPLTNVVKKGTHVTVHLASGKDIELRPLKALKEEKKLSKEALVAMDAINAHTSDLECYTCHATWAPQCYGCHVKIDYSGKKKNVDWLKASHDQDIHGRTGDMKKDLKEYLIDGKVTETRSYLRWENPPLSQNGEGRVSPTIPGCQTTITVIGKEGKALLQNHIFKIPNVEGAGEEGQKAIDMSPVQPHTVQKRSRTCESCHASDKALGLGVDGAKTTGNPSQTTIVDLMTAEGTVIPSIFDEQIPAIKNLDHDYSRFMDENGTQLQTVGHHWTLEGPLNEDQRKGLDRRGVCLSCHINIPEGDLAVSAMVHASEMAGVTIDNETHGTILNKVFRIGAWVQIIAAIIILFVLYKLFFKRRKKKGRW